MRLQDILFVVTTNEAGKIRNFAVVNRSEKSAMRSSQCGYHPDHLYLIDPLDDELFGQSLCMFFYSMKPDDPLIFGQICDDLLAIDDLPVIVRAMVELIGSAYVRELDDALEDY